MLLTIAVTIGSVVLHATQRSHGSKTDTSGLITALGTITAALLVYRVLIDLPSLNEVVDQKIGAYLGLLAAVCLAFGGYESMREERARARRAAKRAKSRARVASGTGPR
jgi:threonine/homoserine/homoserine lactone efflux protein